MTFTFSTALWLLALLPVLALFHFYQVERLTQRITTLALWPTAPRQQGMPRAALRQFQPSVLLLLQGIAFIILVIALANPLFHTTSVGAEHIIVLIDDSASMQVPHQSSTRFDSAKAQARHLIQNLKPGQKAVLSTMTRGIIVPFSTDKQQLISALETLEHRRESRNTAFPSMVALAQSMDSSQMHIFTDGIFDTPIPLNAYAWYGLGEQVSNVGITALNARLLPGRSDQLEVFIRVNNFSSQVIKVPLTIRINGIIISQKTLNLAEDATHSVILPLTNSTDLRVEARIETDDIFQADNEAFLTLPRQHQRRIALITHGNLFLENALATDATTKVVTFIPSTLNKGSTQALTEQFDLVVFDAVPVESFDQRGKYLFIRTLPQEAPLEILGFQAAPTPVDWSDEHSITQSVAFDNTLIKEALVVRPKDKGKTLLESDETPLIHVWESEKGQEGRAVFIGFDLFDSDLRAQVGFPILMQNIVEWLTARITSSVIYPAASDNPNNPLHSRESNLSSSPILPATEEVKTQSYAHAVPLWSWLVLIALIILIIECFLFWAKFPTNRRTPARLTTVLLPNAITLSLLALALLVPSLSQSTDKLHVTIVMDISDSVAQFTHEPNLTKVHEQMREGDSLQGLQFGTYSRLTPISLSVSQDISRADGRHSNLENAINLALATGPPNRGQRIVLLSDGNETQGNALWAANNAAAHQVPIDITPLTPNNLPEVTLYELRAPDEVKVEETYTVRVIAHATKRAPAQLTLFRNQEIAAEQSVELKVGKNVFTYKHHAKEEGYQVYEAKLQPEADTLEQNNTVIRILSVHQRARVLLLDSEPLTSHSLADALSIQGINVDVLGPKQIEEGLTALTNYDALILSNLSSLHLSRAQMERIRTYVHDLGGGLVMLGGEQSFGLGGYYKTPIEEALPVTMIARQRLDVPSTSVVLIIDRSGSMNRSDGEFNRLDLAKEAAQRAASLLGEHSELGVLAFDLKSEWIVPIGPMADRGAILDSIATLRAGGGGTQLLWGLEKAYRAIARRKTAIRHVIILSDGEVYSTRFPELLKNMVRKNITVSAVTIASHVGISQLRNISEMGRGRFYFTGDASKLPRIFTMETQLATKIGLIEEPFIPMVNNRWHEVMRGFDWSTPPALGGYIATTAKRSAQTLLSSHQEDPIMAVWHYGLGRAGVFTSEFKSRWGTDWLQWKDFSALSSTLIRWLLRPNPKRDIAAKAMFSNGNGHIVVDLATSGEKRLNFLQGQLAVIGPNQSQTVTSLIQDSPGRYVGRFSSEDNGIYLLGVSLQQQQRSLPSVTTHLTRSYNTEYQNLGVNHDLLDQLAEITGGNADRALEEVFTRQRVVGEEPWALWPWLTLISLIALLLTVATRWFSDKYCLWER